MSEKVNVYNTNMEVIATVEYNNNLDVWNGSNWQNGGTGLHLGITRLDDGRLVLIHGTDWQGRHDHAEIISEKQAYQNIKKYDDSLLTDPDYPEFHELQKYDKELPQEAQNTISISNVAEVLDATVRPHGNGSHVTIPKKHIGKTVKVVILHE